MLTYHSYPSTPAGYCFFPAQTSVINSLSSFHPQDEYKKLQKQVHVKGEKCYMIKKDVKSKRLSIEYPFQYYVSLVNKTATARGSLIIWEEQNGF
jgi:hypothetical protein